MQSGLFHESFADALRECVLALGGTKVVAARMRPEMPVDHAARWLSDCLNAERREQLHPEQIIWLLREARAINCHAGMSHLAQEAGYSVTPVEPEDERDRLQRDYIEAAIERAYESALAAHRAAVRTARRSLGQRFRRLEEAASK